MSIRPDTSDRGNSDFIELLKNIDCILPFGVFGDTYRFSVILDEGLKIELEYIGVSKEVAIKSLKEEVNKANCYIVAVEKTTILEQLLDVSDPRIDISQTGFNFNIKDVYRIYCKNLPSSESCQIPF